MKKYSFLLVISSILLSIAFVQCDSSETTKAEETQQVEPMLMSAAESAKEPNAIPVEEPKLIEQATPVESPKPIKKVILVDNPKPIKKATPVNNPKPIEKLTPVEEPKSIEMSTPVEVPKPIAKPTPLDEPAALISAAFSLKAVKATINGTSTLHDWESQVTQIEGKGTFQTKDNILATVKDSEIKITVTGIKSAEGKKMDNKTYEAFNSDEHPFIIYAFSNAIVKINAGHIVTVEATGNLSMAGTTQKVSLVANGKELANGDLQLTVSKKIKMTDYKMTPPVMLFGTIKVGDEITVNFDFVLSKI